MSRRGENIRKRSDGRWEGRYIKNRNAEGKAQYGSVYAKTYLEVKRRLAEINIQIVNDALPMKSQNITFEKVLYLWLESIRIKLKPQSYANYRYMIETHIVPCAETIPVYNIDIRYINTLLLKKSVDGRLDGRGGLSSSYIKKIGFIINAALQYAAEEKFCQPFRGELVYPQKKKRELEVLSLTEQAKLDSLINLDYQEQDIGILLSLYAGLRVGEVCGLKCADIDFTTQTIHICHTVERIRNTEVAFGENKTTLVLCDAKTLSSDRIIPIPPILISRLSEIVKRGKTFLLEGRSYEYMDPRTYQYYFSKRLNEWNLRRLKFHALRHTFATRCTEAGMDIKSLSEILGHASTNITLNTYIHSSMEHKQNQIKKMVAYCGQ